MQRCCRALAGAPSRLNRQGKDPPFPPRTVPQEIVVKGRFCEGLGYRGLGASLNCTSQGPLCGQEHVVDATLSSGMCWLPSWHSNLHAEFGTWIRGLKAYHPSSPESKEPPHAQLAELVYIAMLLTQGAQPTTASGHTACKACCRYPLDTQVNAVDSEKALFP